MVGINIVVIDNWISPTSLYERTGQGIQVMLAQVGRCTLQSDTNASDSHGTICASILAEGLSGRSDLVGYSCPGDEGKPALDKVCTALKDCLQEPPAYISMSIGSENWLETAELAELTKSLTDRGTHIFAACANNGHIAFPAAYPWVTGVRYEPGVSGFYREEKSPVGCDIVVGDFASSVLDEMANENSFFECRTNSMATPYALGKMIAEGIPLSTLPLWQSPKCVDVPKELPMPSVAVTGPIERMKELLTLLQKESYQAALFTDRAEMDWMNMVLCVKAENFLPWVKPLAEAGILLIDVEGKLEQLKHFGDYPVDLRKKNVQTAYKDILHFFGTEGQEGGE